MKSALRLTLLLFLVVFNSCTTESVELDNEVNDVLERKSVRQIRVCETAFAYYQGGCFLDDDELNSNRWGWTIGPLSSPIKESYPIYAGAGKCNIDKGERVGDLHVNYTEDGILDITYKAFSGYAFFETHLYYGEDKYPKKRNGKYTVAPGQYGNSNEFPEGTTKDNYSFENVSGEIYIIAHAVVCEVEEECEIDPGTLKADPAKCVYFGVDSTISATPDGNAVVPEGFEVLYVLTTGYELTIVAVNDSPEFLINNEGTYRIHTLVYRPGDLDLSGIVFEVTRAEEVLNLIEANDICAALDVEGAVYKIIFCEEGGF